MSENLKLSYKINEKYEREVSEILERLERMENGGIYGMDDNQSRMDGSLQFNCRKLRNDIISLLSKIQNGSDSEEDKLAKAFAIKDKQSIHRIE